MIIRSATAEDADGMAALLSDIIAAGGTTAIEGDIGGETIREWMARAPGRSVWTVAVEGERVVGFQWAEPRPPLPDEAADIASFVRIGITGQGIGRKMFQATRAGCSTLGYAWINAAIRSDNESGLTYYARLGFSDWKTDSAAALSDGTLTGKTYKRFDL